jgi:hypothetical protein
MVLIDRIEPKVHSPIRLLAATFAQSSAPCHCCIAAINSMAKGLYAKVTKQSAPTLYVIRVMAFAKFLSLALASCVLAIVSTIAAARDSYRR